LTADYRQQRRRTAASGPDVAASRSTVATSWSPTSSRRTSTAPRPKTATSPARRPWRGGGGGRDDAGGTTTATLGGQQVRSAAAGRTARDAGDRSTLDTSCSYTHARTPATSLTAARYDSFRCMLDFRPRKT